MLSKRLVMIVGVILLIAVSVILASFSSQQHFPDDRTNRFAFFLVAPFQEAVTLSSRYLKGIWRQYFNLVSTASENELLRRQLNLAIEKNNQFKEFELSNKRLRSLLNFQEEMGGQLAAAEVVGRDPSPWFKSIILNKGTSDGVEKGSPVVVPHGVVGLIIDTTRNYSKALLVIDQNSAVDAQVQNTRARGIIKGDASGGCLFDYVLRKHDINLGDIVITSGIDGVFPKGLRVGSISRIIRKNSGIFQEVNVEPFVDFETLEEVLIVAAPPKNEFSNLP